MLTKMHHSDCSKNGRFSRYTCMRQNTDHHLAGLVRERTRRRLIELSRASNAELMAELAALRDVDRRGVHILPPFDVRTLPPRI
jgi:hypothetical protein